MSFIVVSILNVDCSFGCILYSSLYRFEKGVLEILLVFFIKCPSLLQIQKYCQCHLSTSSVFIT